MNLIKLILAPALRRRFKFKEVKTVNFKANYLDDTLQLDATGLNMDSETVKGETNNLKISENKHYIDIFESNLKAAGVRFKKIDVVNMEIDFKNNTVVTIVFFVDLNDLKQKQTVTSNF